MHVAIFDTNVLRGLSPADFTAIKAAEVNLGIRPYADLWTVVELIAHLNDSSDPSYWPSRRALQRCVARSLLPTSQPPLLIAPSELQMSRLVFGNLLASDEANMNAHIDLARTIAAAEDGDDLSSVSPAIHAIAAHLEDKEQWFASYFAGLREEVFTAASGSSASARNAAVRAFTQHNRMRHECKMRGPW